MIDICPSVDRRKDRIKDESDYTAKDFRFGELSLACLQFLAGFPIHFPLDVKRQSDACVNQRKDCQDNDQLFDDRGGVVDLLQYEMAEPNLVESKARPGLALKQVSACSFSQSERAKIQVPRDSDFDTTF